MQENNDERKVLKTAIDIIHHINRAFRTSKIYEPNNRIFLRQIKLLHQHIQNIHKIQEESAFILRQNSLLFNNMKLKFNYSNYYLFKFFYSELQKKDVGELLFLPDVSENELTRFILLLAEKNLSPDNPFQAFLDRLKESNINNIYVNNIPAFEKTENKDKASKKIFFLSMTHLKEMFEKQEEKHISLTTTKRLMQAIFNHISDNESFLFGLTNIKNFDEYTLNHSVNVCILSISLGKKMGLDRNELIDLGLSAFFHDFGKLEIPKDILLKPGKLDKKERNIIQLHPHYGAEMLIQMKEFSHLPLQALTVAMEHHLSEDDSGYPKYKKKNNINLFSKMVKITDFFDAITTKRPYRKKDFSREHALTLMLELSGKEFNPLILKVFVNMMGTYPVGTLVLLNTAEIGIVYENSAEALNFNRPKIKLITDEEGNKTDGKIVDLSEIDYQTKSYKKSISKTLEPTKYDINVSDYFIAEAE